MRLPAITFSRQDLSSFDDALQKEWLLTNGLGGYASSTVLGVNTRKYHGLLVAALRPPSDRNVCLAKLDEEFTLNGNVYLLGANEFQDAVFPTGFIHLNEFSVSPFPRFIYAVEGAEIQKTIFVPYRKNAVVVMYRVQNRARDSKVRVFPLLTCRHIHTVVDKWANPLSYFQKTDDRKEVHVLFTTPRAATIAIRATNGDFHEKSNWIERLRYRQDEMRGETSMEDCYQPGYFEIIVPSEGIAEFAIVTVVNGEGQRCQETLDEIGATMSEVKHAFRKEMERQTSLLSRSYLLHADLPRSNWLSWLFLAADTFIVANTNNRKSIIAGYHWYEAWGRDTFISMAGLMLTTGRFENARNLLSAFGAYCSQGLIPNFLNDKSGKASYNSVDATLWFVNAVLQYLKYTGDFDFVRSQLWQTLRDIIKNHVRGTAFGIGADTDGLLEHGERLTWMDAEVNGKAMTPRAGKAVEIQALWYNAIRTVQLLADRFEEKTLADDYSALAEKVKASFARKFWNEEENCLFDVIGETGVDASIRPNQIFSVSLDFTMLSQNQNLSILKLVQKELLTPYGLRTLSRNDPKYLGLYSGDRWRRDCAYHNGTAWPWLLGPIVTAFLKTEGNTAQNQENALRDFLLPLFTQQICKVALGTISEIFDGDKPHSPNGCVSQAWSVAEPLRAYIEDVLQIRPKCEKEVLQL